MRQQVRSNWTGARMSIEIHCDNCQKRYRVKADLAGKRVRCANCGNPVTVPGGGGNNGGADEQLISELPSQNPGSKKPAPPKAPPPPVPRQVVRFDPRFDPQAMTDIPAPPPPAAPPAPKPAPQRTPQPVAKKERDGRELRFVDDDPLFMSKPKPATYDNLSDTAAAPAISGDSPEPRLDREPLGPRGKRGSGKLADTDVPRPSDQPDLDIPGPSERPVFSMP